MNKTALITGASGEIGSAISLVMCVVILVTMYFTKKLDYGKDE